MSAPTDPEGGKANAVLPFALIANRHPDRTALNVDGRDYSYGILAGQAARIAGWMRERIGGAPGRVGILAARSLPAYLGILGTCWGGAGYVPLNPDLPSRRLRQIIGLAGPEAILLERACLDRIDESTLGDFQGALFLLDGPPTEAGGRPVEGWEGMRPPEAVATPVSVSLGSDAYVVFTSGTTGEPNGVAVSVGNLARAVDMITSAYGFGPDDRFSQFFDLSFDFSVMDLFVPWSVGAATYVVPSRQKLDPRRLIQDNRLTVWTCIPSLIGMMRRMGTLRPGIFPSLKLSCFSGEGLTKEAAQAWQEAAPNSRVINLYGQTEAPIGSLAQEYGPEARVTPDNGFVAIGRPLRGASAGVLSPEGAFQGRGAAGELAVSGDHVAVGYLHNPEFSERKFPIMDHPDLGRRRWYRTGDLAREDDDGFFHFLGRLDNELKVAGHRVALEEIEFYLRKSTADRECAVIPWASGQGAAEAVVAFVAAAEIDERALKEEMKRFLPRPVIPRRIVALEKLPLSRNGKVDRKALVRLWQEMQTAG